MPPLGQKDMVDGLADGCVPARRLQWKLHRRCMRQQPVAPFVTFVIGVSKKLVVVEDECHVSLPLIANQSDCAVPRITQGTRISFRMISTSASRGRNSYV